ncbi:hypothetical protein FRC01_010373 [Tulasnella sp. 417]|nr:hypothetical protein FRC01_010373 [Tulasnella sp. 417]
MAYVNLYKPPQTDTPVQLPKDDEPLDLNFCLPVPDELSSERVKLVPFIPALHRSQLLDGVTGNPALYTYLPYGPFDHSSVDAFNLWHEQRIRGDPSTVLFAIIDKTSPSPDSHPSQGGALAGVIAYLLTFPQTLSTEIGHILILPKWQRTFLNTNAVGLLLIHALEVPENGGWGLRRVQWQANAENGPSRRAAERMGFKMEGIIRWQRLLPGANGRPSASAKDRKGDPQPDVPGRHTAMLALCWDHYDRASLEALMDRKK